MQRVLYVRNRLSMTVFLFIYLFHKLKNGCKPLRLTLRISSQPGRKRISKERKKRKNKKKTGNRVLLVVRKLPPAPFVINVRHFLRNRKRLTKTFARIVLPLTSLLNGFGYDQLNLTQRQERLPVNPEFHRPPHPPLTHPKMAV